MVVANADVLLGVAEADDRLMSMAEDWLEAEREEAVLLQRGVWPSLFVLLWSLERWPNSS